MNAQVSEVDTLRAQVAALTAKLAVASKPRSISFKVTAPKLDEKTGEMKGTSGAISAYGLGKFPITLYAGQWERLMSEADALRAFIEANAAIIARK